MTTLFPRVAIDGLHREVLEAEARTRANPKRRRRRRSVRLHHGSPVAPSFPGEPTGGPRANTAPQWTQRALAVCS